MDELDERIFKAYFRRFGKDADIPCSDIEKFKIKGNDYGVLRNVHGILAVYRVKNDGNLKFIEPAWFENHVDGGEVLEKAKLCVLCGDTISFSLAKWIREGFPVMPNKLSCEFLDELDTEPKERFDEDEWINYHFEEDGVEVICFNCFLRIMGKVKQS